MRNILTNKINTLIQTLNEGSCDPLIVTALFKHIRELIEHTGAGQKFQLLNFYCNCLLHVEMDRGVWLAMFFETINSAFQDNFKPDNDDAIFSSLSKAISLGELRHEIITFLSFNNIQGNGFLRDDLWYAVLSMIARDLIGKKIKFPTSGGQTKEIRNRMIERNAGTQMSNLPCQLEFFVDNDKKIMWKISYTKDDVNYPHGFCFQALLLFDGQVEVKGNVILPK